MKFLCAFPLLLLILCGATLAVTQSTNATISGVVVDPAGKIIPGAEIEIVNDATGVHYSSETNGTGIYSVAILPPGEYRLQVSKVGFKTLIKPGVVLNVQSALALNFTLPVGATSESITVEAGASSINTNDGSVSTVIDRDFVENMPLNGRSFQDLLILAPGVAQVANPSGTSGLGGDIVVNGQRTEANYFTVDGVSANTGYAPGQVAGVSGNVPGLTALGTTQSLVSIDGLQEFRSSTSSYSAEYGRSPGGQFAFTTRSGTNILHGSLYDYFRNDMLDANNWFNDYYHDTKGKERQNDFGGTVGGPVILPNLYDGHSRTFFFFSYEGLRLDSPQAASPVLVPDTTLRRMAPNALQALLNAFPVADHGEDGLNDGFAYYIQSVSYPSTLNNTSIRLDHAFGDKLSAFLRFADTPSDSTTYSGAVKQTTSLSSHSITLGSTYAVTAHESNELRFNYSETGGQAAQQSTFLGGAIPFSLNSIPGPNGASFPSVNSELYTVFTFASFAKVTLSDLTSSQNQFNVTDQHSWVVGRHNVTVGIDWKRLVADLPSNNPMEGVAFTNEADVLANQPAIAFAETFNSSSSAPQYLNFSSFVQDEWKVAPRWALSLGLRWDIDPAPTNTKGPNAYTITSTNVLTTALAPRGTPLWKTDWHGFAPRIGVAYQRNPGSSHNTVLRAGGGVFYDLGSTLASLGYVAIGFESSQDYFNATFPLTSAQLSSPPLSAAPPYTSSVVGFDPNLKLPYTLQYNAAIEQALSRNDSVTVGYVGSGARRLLTEFSTYPGAVGNPDFAASTTLDLVQGRAASGYNAFQAKYQRAVSRGIQVLASYTWSHSIDDASSNFGNYELLRASSDFDIRHDLQVAATFAFPSRKDGRTLAAALASKWALDCRFQARTAVPVDIVGNQDLDLQTGQYLAYRPSLVSGQPLYHYGHTYPGGRIMNYDAFEIEPDGVQGDVPRNFARAFGALQLDTAIRRDFVIREGFHLQTRVEAFNVFNHPMFGPIYSALSYGPSLFGQSYNTLNSLGNLNSLYQSGGPRSLQASLKLSF